MNDQATSKHFRVVEAPQTERKKEPEAVPPPIVEPVAPPAINTVDYSVNEDGSKKTAAQLIDELKHTTDVEFIEAMTSEANMPLKTVRNAALAKQQTL